MLVSLCNDRIVALLFKNDELNNCFSPFQIMHKVASQASISFDNKYLLCSGSDGTIHVYTLENDHSLSDSGQSASFIREVFAPNSKCNDLDKYNNSKSNSAALCDNNRYTLQKELLSNLEKQSKRSAENKKNIVRKLVNDLRKEYSHLIIKNSKLPVLAQLNSNEMDVDESYKELASQETDNKINDAYNSSMHKTHRCENRRKKLQDKYLNIFEHEYFVVSGLSNHHKQQCVQSFPACKLSHYLQDTIKRIEKRSALGHVHSTDNGDNLEYKVQDIDIEGKEKYGDPKEEKCADNAKDDSGLRSTYETRKVCIGI